MKNLFNKRWFRLMAVAALLIFGAGAAMAGQSMGGPDGKANGVWTIYAFSNADAVGQALRAVANFVASSMFRNMVLFLAVTGTLVIAGSSGFSPGMGRKFIGYMVSIVLLGYVLVGGGGKGPITVNVEVYDTVDGKWVSPMTVPAIMGVPAAMISTAGFEIMRQVEASFGALPAGLKMSNGAPFNLAATLINDASKAKITDSNLSSSLAMYVQDCFIPAVARGEKDAATLLTSTDFINDLKYSNKALMVNSFLPDGTPNLVNCDSGHKLIVDAVNQGGTAADYLREASAWASTPALSVVNSAADTIAQWATGDNGQGGAALIKQSAVLASFSGAFRQAAAQTGNSDFLTGLAITQAHEAQLNSWVTGAEIFNRTMGYIFAILQVFVYAITPLILAAAIIPSLGMSLLKNYCQILLWMAIWQPMLAIVNFIVLAMQQADLQGVLATGTKYGFTMGNMGIITQKTSNMRAAATFVGTMVPALAWAMVKGSIDISRVIGSAVGENFAQGAANTVTTGNYSLNSASMDSFTANKHSVGATFDAGRGFSAAGNGGVNDKNEMGGKYNPASGDSSAGVSARGDYSTGNNAQHGSAANTGVQGAKVNQSTLAGSVGTGTVDATGVGHTNNSGVTKALTGQAGGSATLSTSLGGGGAGGAGSNGGPSGPAPTDKSDGNAPVASQLKGKDLPFKAGAQLSASLTGSKSAVVGSADTDTHNITNSASANLTNTGSTSNTGQVVAGHQETAGTTDTAGTNKSLAVTTLAPQAEQRQVQHQALHFATGRFERYAQREGNNNEQVFYGRPSDSGVGKVAADLATSGNVVNAVEAGKTTAAKLETEYGKKGDKLNADAVAGKDRNIGGARAAMAADNKEISELKPNAQVKPTERVAKSAEDGYEWMASKASALMPSKETINKGLEAVAAAQQLEMGYVPPVPVTPQANQAQPAAPATGTPQQTAAATPVKPPEPPTPPATPPGTRRPAPAVNPTSTNAVATPSQTVAAPAAVPRHEPQAPGASPAAPANHAATPATPGQQQTVAAAATAPQGRQPVQNPQGPMAPNQHLTTQVQPNQPAQQQTLPAQTQASDPIHQIASPQAQQQQQRKPEQEEHKHPTQGQPTANNAGMGAPGQTEKLGGGFSSGGGGGGSREPERKKSSSEDGGGAPEERKPGMPKQTTGSPRAPD